MADRKTLDLRDAAIGDPADTAGTAVALAGTIDVGVSVDLVRGDIEHCTGIEIYDSHLDLLLG